MSTHLIWFRTDLRLYDNLALSAACYNQNARILALFIATPEQWKKHSMAKRQASFLYTHLNNLKKSLSEKGIPLLYEQVNDFTDQCTTIQKICKKENVTHLFYNYQYELNERQRDKTLEKSFNKTISCQGFNDSVILSPGSIMTKKHKMYKVFTPFKKAWIKHLKESGVPKCVPAPSVRRNDTPDSVSLNLKFDYPKIDFDTSLFPNTEKKALIQLQKFCKNSVIKYEKKKNHLDINSTSRLSACLALGILSPRQFLNQLLITYPKAMDGGVGTIWLNELIWREFYRHLIVHYPNLCKHRPFVEWTNGVRWKKSEIYFDAWKKGKTGYPIVDAAMRQLNNSGWIHNRLRMVAAGFLVKNLLIDWRIGENYFISQLIDGDLAANNGNWQWIASTGPNAMPFFRIFNPTVQGKKFDSSGKLLRQWLPELSKIPDDAIHNPWDWADKFNIVLNYPRPIIDHKKASIATIEAYRSAYKQVSQTNDKK